MTWAGTQHNIVLVLMNPLELATGIQHCFFVHELKSHLLIIKKFKCILPAQYLDLYIKMCYN